jgi:hypothetical protein
MVCEYFEVILMIIENADFNGALFTWQSMRLDMKLSLRFISGKLYVYEEWAVFFECSILSARLEKALALLDKMHSTERRNSFMVALCTNYNV